MTAASGRSMYTEWAIVACGGSCGQHPGPCPNGVWGPYSSFAEAEQAVRFVTNNHQPHVVPYFARGYQGAAL
ncbi:hypothetical protein [Nocardia wallacei]|uniref:hypothetical protein n=1 Tax=Nocardia wallacei TaxID=480035 RepID=UPI002454D8FF|nr:hypothetical protein [Nocardia wallacei]